MHQLDPTLLKDWQSIIVIYKTSQYHLMKCEFLALSVSLILIFQIHAFYINELHYLYAYQQIERFDLSLSVCTSLMNVLLVHDHSLDFCI